MKSYLHSFTIIALIILITGIVGISFGVRVTYQEFAIGLLIGLLIPKHDK